MGVHGTPGASFDFHTTGQLSRAVSLVIPISPGGAILSPAFDRGEVRVA